MAALPMVWVVAALLMVRSHLADPYDPGRTGRALYGHNGSGALLHGLVVTLVELAVASALLRPWSYRRSWGRALGALSVFLPWAVFSLLLTMHAGGIFALHFLWVATVAAALMVCVVWSLLAAWWRRPVAGARGTDRARTEER